MGPSNDMGFTWGHYEGHSTDNNGQPVVTSGRYITFWKKAPRRRLEGRSWTPAPTSPRRRRMLHPSQTLSHLPRTRHDQPTTQKWECDAPPSSTYILS